VAVELTCLKTEPSTLRLTQINSVAFAPPRIQPDGANEARLMFDSSELRDELRALKGDMSRLLNTAGEGNPAAV